jgi:anti-anti-sigma factor
MTNVDSIAAVIEPVLATATERLIVDVRDLEFLDSSGVAVLVRCAQRVGRVELRHPTQIIRRTVESMGLTEILHLEP